MERIDNNFYNEKEKITAAVERGLSFVGTGHTLAAPDAASAHVYAAPIVRKSIVYNTPADDMAKNPASCVEFELTQSEVNTRYAIMCGYATSMRWIELTYE